jgi:hypothetical protein
VTNRGLATGVFRAWGLMWLVYAFVGLAQLLAQILGKPYKWETAEMASYALSVQVLSVVFTIIIAVFLVVKSSWLATIVFPVEKETGFSIGADELRAVLFAAIGLYFLLDGLQLLAGSGYQLAARFRGGEKAMSYVRSSPETFVRGLVSAIVGALVLFGRRGLSGLYQRVFGLRDEGGGPATEEK